MTTTTPNMNLVLPDVLITTGPQWATLIDAAYTLIDSHDHSSGNGVRVTPSGLNISSDLSFVQNNATNLRTARLFNNSAISLGVNDKTCLYSLNNELYYVDGAGNNVQVTISGALNISTSITALTLKDTGFFLEYFGDVTKKLRFDVSSIPTATTRILSVPDSGMNDTFVTLGATQTITSKTLTSSVLSGNTAATLISGSGTLVLPTTGTQTIQNATDTIVSRATTDTLTNKILTGNTIASFTPNGGTNTLNAPAVNGTLSVITAVESPTNKTFDSTSIMTGVRIASFTPDGTHTLTNPAVTDTIVARTTTDTLTNKTLTSPTINSATLNTPTLPTYEDIIKTTVPPSPSAGNIRLYASTVDGLLHFVNSAGSDVAVGTGTSSTSPATTSSAGTITREGIWTSYTPTVSAGFGTISGLSAFYKVLGDSLFIKVFFTTGNCTAAVGTISIPAGFTISSTKIPVNTTIGNKTYVAGHWSQDSNLSGNVLVYTGTSTTDVYLSNIYASTSLINASSTTANTNNSSGIAFEYELAIV